QDTLAVNQYLKLSFQDRGQEVGRDKQSKVIKLPPQTNLLEVFERQDVGRRLLILGEPGAGKTTSLLKLAAELITQAEKNPTIPIPVLFELSAWKSDRQSIEQWLVEQLKDNYSINFQISQRWLEQNRILPLLDGLDELGLVRQKLAIEKINQYLQQDIARQLVVCCRWEEYKQGEVQLYRLNGAYYLQPPTETDIKDYLSRLNQQDLWQKIATNGQMRELAQKPLFLNLMMTAFQGEAIVSEKQLFTSYVEEQLSRPLDLQKYPQRKPPYSDQDTKKYLTYLAGQLEADSLTVFLIEKMQPYWLNPGRERWIFRFIFSVVVVLVIGFFGLIFGLFLWLRLNLEFSKSLILGLIYGLIGGLLLGLFYGFILWSFKEYKIKAESFKFTWQGFKRGLIRGVMFGLIFTFVGFIGGLIFGLIFEILFAWKFLEQSLEFIFNNLIIWIRFKYQIYWGILGLNLGLVFGLVYGAFSELNVEIKSREMPNQGIRESKNKTLIIFLFLSLFFMSFFVLRFLFIRKLFGWMESIIWSLFLGLSVSLATGGVDLIQHLTLRLILHQQGLIPRNYAHFLKYAGERKLIHRIGGHYRFLHDSLRKYFASQATIPERVIKRNSIY
ncbi:MAG: NACHT domain-containing protein, partial [Cyanobacteria bacterium P01_A01_bin.40]